MFASVGPVKLFRLQGCLAIGHFAGRGSEISLVQEFFGWKSMILATIGRRSFRATHAISPAACDQSRACGNQLMVHVLQFFDAGGETPAGE